MIHQRGVVVPDGRGRVEQRCQQILLDVADFRCVLLHAVHDKVDMLAVELQKPGLHNLMGEVAASYPCIFPLGTDSMFSRIKAR